MTEAEWLKCTDPKPMLEFLGERASQRKLRLFAVVCCRRLWNLLSDKYSRKALTIAERYADGDVSQKKLGFARGDARRAAEFAHREERPRADASAMWAVSLVCEAFIGSALVAVGLAARCEAYPGYPSRLADAQKEQSSLLRDMFGSPFRVVTNDPNWLTATVTKLAQAAYDNRILPAGTLEPDRLAILADALEEAGCTDEQVLTHLRGPSGPHVRGCFVLDLLLDKK